MDDTSSLAKRPRTASHCASLAAGSVRGGEAPAAGMAASAGLGGDSGEGRATLNGSPDGGGGGGTSGEGQRIEGESANGGGGASEEAAGGPAGRTRAGEARGRGGVTRVAAGQAEDRGSRHTFEDVVVATANAWGDADDGAPAADRLRCSFYAVLDGHGGRRAAEWAGKHVNAAVIAAGLPRESVDVKKAKRAITEGMKRVDEQLLKESLAGNWQDGATAVCVWVLGQHVFVANLGDAKAVLAREPDAAAPPPPAATAPTPTVCAQSTDSVGGAGTGASGASLKALVVTREHKAIFPAERRRIEKAGGSIINGRIQGRLEVSRAFGDRQFKKAGVSCTPDINVFHLSPRDCFLLLACDGLWGVFSPADAVNFTQGLLQKGVSVESAARRVVKEAVWERKCKDNCSVLLLSFHHSST
ncbi:hypothetical protein CLOM_g10628 [Closterium sp. NIES-68]|nr:hypothetical protein CLOM_g10628 [Closterium sp. NIES-68]GJP86407.1 hypothetical protein CLOP_g16431 [Closterium sp. NIES-67]